MACQASRVVFLLLFHHVFTCFFGCKTRLWKTIPKSAEAREGSYSDNSAVLKIFSRNTNIAVTFTKANDCIHDFNSSNNSSTRSGKHIDSVAGNPKRWWKLNKTCVFVVDVFKAFF